MPFAVQGTGTRYYGMRDFRKDGTYITTEWFVILHIPVIPLRSLRVRGRSGFSVVVFSSRSYSIYSKGSPNLKQVLFTYSYLLLIAAWIFFVCALCSKTLSTSGSNSPAVSLAVISFLLPAPLPRILRYYAKRKLRRALQNQMRRQPPLPASRS
jgi:hypothetical protein